MINKLKQFFSSTLSLQAIDLQADDPQSRKLAAVALMIEIIAVDSQQTLAEQQALKHVLQNQFELVPDEVEALIKQAVEEHKQATDYYQFTSEINRSYSAEQKIDLIETLWRLAWADNELHQLEEHVIRRLANLLHVPHKDFIATKLRVVEG